MSPSRRCSLLRCVPVLAAVLLSGCGSPPSGQATGDGLPRLSGPLADLPSFQDLMELDTVSEPAVDASGMRVAYVRRKNAVDAPRLELHVWSEAGDRFVIGSEDGFTGGATWTPDGRLAFLGRGDQGTTLVFVNPESSGSSSAPQRRPIPLDGVRSVSLSADGRLAALLVADPEPAVREQEQVLIGPFEEEDVPAAPVHVWVLDLGDSRAEPRRLTSGEFSVETVVWSPSRPELAVVVGPQDARNNFWLRDISLLDAESGALVPWVAQAGRDDSPVWSPDGDRLAFSTTLGDALTNAAPELAVVRRPAGDASDELPPLEVLSRDFRTEPMPVAWGRDGVIFLSAIGTGRALFQVQAGGGIRSLTPMDLVVAGVGASFPQAPALGLLAASHDGLFEVYRMTLPEAELTRATDASAQVAGWPLGTRETIRWSAEDGVVIEGVLHKPEGFEPNERRPLLVVVHGGPRSASVEALAPNLGRSTYPVVHWLWKGALVLQPNYRGSSAYGTDFRRLHRAGVGAGDSGDVLAGIRYLVARGLVDPERVGVMGWSYGGFISAYLSATSTEIAAASVGAGITDWGTHYGWEYDNFTTRDFSFAGPPWERETAYRRASPLEYIAGASVPTLVQHVEDDPIVPMAGARRFYRALLERGVPTRMIVYPGRTHGIPQARQALGSLWHNWQWFAHYLWHEEVAIPIEEAAGS